MIETIFSKLLSKLPGRAVMAAALALSALLPATVSAQEGVVRIFDGNSENQIVGGFGGFIQTLPDPIGAFPSLWRLSQYVDCTTGQRAPLIMITNTADNMMISMSGIGKIGTTAYNQDYHCSVPPEQLPYLFAVEVAANEYFNTIRPDGQYGEVQMPSQVYLRNYTTGTYLVPPVSSSNGSGLVELSNQKYPWRIRLNGPDPMVPPNYLATLAAELPAFDQMMAQRQPAEGTTFTTTPATPRQPAPPAPNYDTAWHNALPIGSHVGLLESGSTRGLQIVPALTVSPQATQTMAGQWTLLAAGLDPVTGQRVIENQPLYNLQHVETGYFLALSNGQLILRDVLNMGPNPAINAEVQWELLPSQPGATTFHVRHSATGNYAYLQNGQIYVAGSPQTPWSFN